MKGIYKYLRAFAVAAVAIVATTGGTVFAQDAPAGPAPAPVILPDYGFDLVGMVNSAGEQMSVVVAASLAIGLVFVIGWAAFRHAKKLSLIHISEPTRPY